MKYANGNKYTGDWKYNEKSGDGKMVYPDGTIQKGRFEEDLFHAVKKINKT